MNRLHLIASAMIAAAAALCPIDDAAAALLNRSTAIPNARTAPIVSVSVDGQTASLAAGLAAGPNGAFAFNYANPATHLIIGSGVITLLQGTANGDPFVNFSIGVTDTSVSGSPFVFAFSIPLSPLLIDGKTYAVTSTLGVTLTAPAGITDTLTPTFGNTMLNNVGGCAAGVDIGDTLSIVEPNPAISLVRNYSASNTFVASAGCDDSLTAFIAFQGSGAQSAYGITGNFAIAQVPEPGGLAVFATGLMAAIGAARRRKSYQRPAV